MLSLLSAQNSEFIVDSHKKKKNLTSCRTEMNLYSRVVIIRSRKYNRQIHGLADLCITINPSGIDFIQEALVSI